MIRRQSILKSTLWALFGVLAIMTLARFFRGLGATTNLNESTPWGMWIAFDIMAGVALAAGGFVLAATVYILGLKKYKEFTRPAILTAFLGYCAVAVGLMYDLGLPWHVYNLFLFPQPTSVLFEVGLCVVFYLSVLGLEFAPVVLEHPWFQRPFFQKIHRFLKKATIPLVIAGIALSTLHQSSLGSLFLITPYRLHELWYSPIIWILFFVSAIGLGLMMVTAESYFSAWFFGHKLKMDKLGGLGLAASFVLLAYVGLRVGDLALRGNLGLAFDGSWQANLFLFEVFLAALLPALLLLIKPIRTNKVWLALCSGMVVLGMIGYRFDVCIVAFYRPENMPYFPSWMEIAVSVGIVATFMLIFIFFVEHLKVYPDEHEDVPPPVKPLPAQIAYQPAGMRQLLPWRLAGMRRYSLAAIGAAALAVALLPSAVISGDSLKETPVLPVRVVPGSVQGEPGGVHELLMGATAVAGAEQTELMIVDGNRDGRFVLFAHDRHAGKLGGKESCNVCHHQNLPLDSHSACSQCHRDMYVPTDTFNHDLHVDKLGDVAACEKCHGEPEGAKTRKTATGCDKCHQDMLVPDSFIKPAGGMVGYAPGYMDAMHGLCINCHKKMATETPEAVRKDFAECATCHRGVDHESLQRMMPLPASQRP